MGVISSINTTLLGRNTWPPAALADRWEEVELFAALRDSDEDRVRQQASVNWAHPYILSPLPRMISRASANLLFGEPADVTASNDTDQEALDALVSDNDLASELVRAALISSSEGEVWGRVIVQPALQDSPIIEWCSPSRVIPHFHGRFVLGATFVTEWSVTGREVMRLLESYDPGTITSTLYRGTNSSIGTPVPLDSFGPTEGRMDVVTTGIDQALVAFVPNSLGPDPTRGFSDYRGLEARFLAINEATTIAQQNLKLAGRKRALVDAQYLDRNGKLVDGDDVFVRQADDEMMGDAAKPLQMIDYQYDSAAVTAWVDHLLDSTLAYAGIAPQMVGRELDGGATSGTALRLRMSHSLLEASGKGRHFDKGLARLLRFAAIIDGRPTTEGGFGRRWADADTPPTVRRADGLMRDDKQTSEIIAALVGAEVVSLEGAVGLWRPDWTSDQVAEEVARIQTERSTTGSTTPVTISTQRPTVTVPGA